MLPNTHSKHLARDSVYSIDLILNQWKKKTLAGKKINRSKNRRLRVFRQHGTNCVYCGLKGSFFAVEKHRKGPNKRGWHLNLYAKMPTGGGVRLMTIDHVIPRADAGTNNIENLRPACSRCNARKSDTHVDKWLAKEGKKRVSYHKRVIDWARFFEWSGWKRRIKYMWYTRKLPAMPMKKKWIKAKV